MKKILLLFLICGCQPIEEPASSAIKVLKSDSYGWNDSIQTIEYGKHSYILFSRDGAHGDSISVIHSPDCPCKGEVNEGNMPSL